MMNAYNLSTNQPATVNNTDPNSGMDCAIVQPSCNTPAQFSKATIPPGFCDLGVYVVWTGTDAAGVEFSSAGRRFRRFRDYGMQTQLSAMQNWSPLGNSISGGSASASSLASDFPVEFEKIGDV